MTIKTNQLNSIVQATEQASEVCFSARELEIVHYLSEGKNSKEIAECLCISVHTVDTHRRKMLAKFNVNNVAHLVGIAFRKGVIQ